MWPIEIRRNYTYNNGNEILTQNGTSFSYDANGNMVSKTNQCGMTTYQYDSENRLIGINGFKPDCSSLTASFKYDPFGRRIEKNINGTITRYIYDREDILFELDGSGNVVTEYLHSPGIDEPIAMIRNNQTYYYRADGLGSIIAITDSTGKVVQRYEYDSFGNITYQQDANLVQPYTYTGREYDQESGLYYYRARYYDAKVGRFITQDPIGFSGGINFYRYVGNSPVNYADPLGLLNIIGGVGGSAVGITGIEGSAGVVINTSGGLNNVGFTGSLGAGGGLNISGDVYLGIITGDISNVSGKTYNINVVGGPISVTVFVDAQGNVIGFTIGYGPGVPIGASGTQSITGVLTLQDILNFIRDKFKSKPCPD